MREDGRIPKRLLHANILDVSRRGKPGKRWLEAFEQNLRRMGIFGWRIMTQQLDDWKKIGEAKAHKGM